MHVRNQGYLEVWLRILLEKELALTKETLKAHLNSLNELNQDSAMHKMK